MVKAKLPSISRRVVRRSIRLLDMQYRPSELANELGVTAQIIYKVWLPAGLPCERDVNGQLWIIGAQFRHWVESENVIRKGNK